MTDNISNLLNSRVSGAVAGVKQGNAEPVKTSPDRGTTAEPVPILGESSRSKEAVSQEERFNPAELQDKRDLSFGIDDQSGRTVITVTESESGQVVRQIPSEETLAVVRQLSEAIEENSADGEAKLPNGIILSFSV